MAAALMFALAIPATGFARMADAPSRTEAKVVELEPQAQQKAPKPKKPKKPKKRAEQKRKPSVEDMIRDAFGKRADDAMAIAKCESRFNPKARSHAGARGIFQIMPVHAWRIAHVDGTHLDDPKTNIRVARHLFEDEGWRPWVCARLLGVR